MTPCAMASSTGPCECLRRALGPVRWAVTSSCALRRPSQRSRSCTARALVVSKPRRLVGGTAGIIDPQHAQRDAEHIVVPVPASRQVLAPAGTRIHLNGWLARPCRLAVRLCLLFGRTPRQ